MTRSLVLSLLLLLPLCATAGVSLDGTDDLVSVGDVSALNFANTSFTVSCWVKGSTPAGTVYLLAKRTAASGSGGYFARMGTDGALTARILTFDGLSAGNRDSTSTLLFNGSWHHVAVVYTTDTTTLANNDVSLYIDGSLDQGGRTDSAATAYGVPTGIALVLGAASDLQNFLLGDIHVCSLYPAILSVNEIETLAKSRLVTPNLTRAPVAHWVLDTCADGTAGNGVTVVDRSGNGVTATIDDGANNTGATCRASDQLSSVGGVR